MAKKKAAATPATSVLNRLKISYTVHHYDHDPANDHQFGKETACVLNLPQARVFKTLVVAMHSGRDPFTCAVVPADSHLDLKALAEVCQAKKATMAEPRDAERITGYIVGGISPLGQKTSLRVVIDASSRSWDTVVVSGGRRGFSVELAPDDLARAAGGIFAKIRRLDV